MDSEISDGHERPERGRVPRTRSRLARLLGGAALATGVALAAGAVALAVLWPQAPGLSELRALQAAKPSVLLSDDGQVLTRFVRAQHEPVPLAQVSPQVVRALIATEDHRFHEHRGIDLKRTGAAVFHTLSGNTQGGSTLTQQLARNLFPEAIGREQTLTRKLKELITALRIERAYTKDQILETYLNSAPFLYNVVGIEMAARTYYDKSAAQLDALESATLIGMLKGTRYYNPILNPERARERRNVVLAQMVKHGALSEADYPRLREQPLKVSLHRQPDVLGPAPHFAVQARRWLIGWADEHGYNLYTDGLVIQTTIDSGLQQAALRAVERQASALQAVADVEWSRPAARLLSHSTGPYERAHAKVDAFAHFWKLHDKQVDRFVRETPQFKQAVAAHGSEAAALQALVADADFMARLKRSKTRLEAGFVAIDPRSGEVKAWVGSRDFGVDQYDHVAQATRQPGSTFKPFVYGAALESGLHPDRLYTDAEVAVALEDGTVWRPTDMGGPSGALMTLRDGLVYSRNTITVQVAQEVGIARIASLARAMGVDQSPLDAVPSLALGTSPVSLLEMASGYATIADQGRFRKPVSIKRITDRHGAVLADFDSPARRVMSADSAVDLIDMLRGVVSHGTGTQIKTRFGVGNDIAGKTGTTQNNTDGWFLLMRPDLVAGAWVGFNDSRVTMRSDHWGQGGHNAVLLVGDFFRHALKEGLVDPKPRFPPPRRPALAAPGPWPMEGEAVLRIEPPGSASPTEVVLQIDSEGFVIGDRASIATSRRAATAAAADAPKSAEELGQAMQRMGRDPETGQPTGNAIDTAPGAFGLPLSR